MKTTLTDGQLEARADAQAARKAARMAERDPGALLLRRADRQAARRADSPAPMAGWRTAIGVPLPPDAALGLNYGTVAVQDTTVDGVVNPTQTAVSGQSYVAAATITGPRAFIGLQWITTDGTPAGIEWAGGRGRVVVTGVAPDHTGGVRVLLVAYTKKPADLALLDAESLAVQQNLRAWLVASRGTDGG